MYTFRKKNIFRAKNDGFLAIFGHFQPFFVKVNSYQKKQIPYFPVFFESGGKRYTLRKVLAEIYPKMTKLSTFG